MKFFVLLTCLFLFGCSSLDVRPAVNYGLGHISKEVKAECPEISEGTRSLLNQANLVTRMAKAISPKEIGKNIPIVPVEATTIFFLRIFEGKIRTKIR